MRKKILSLILACTTLAFAGCSVGVGSSKNSGEASVPTVTIWGSGGQEVREALENVAKAFNNDPEYSKKATVKIEYVVSGTNEQSLPDRLAAAYKAGETETDFDIIALDDSTISTIYASTGDDFFEEIDTSLIPNYENVLFEPEIGKGIFVPYRGTAVYLAYNSNNVENPPKTSEELNEWIKENPGRFAYNTPYSGGSGNSFVVKSIYDNLPEEAALSSDLQWKDDYEEVWTNGIEELKELHPYLYQTAGKVQYPNKNSGSLDLLANNEIDMTPAFVNMVLSNKSMGVLPEHIEMIQIDQPFAGALAGFTIPKYSGEKEAALDVIDFFLGYEAQAIGWNSMYAFPVVDSSKLIGLENSEWLDELDFNEVRYFSIGGLNLDIHTLWEENVGVLAK